VDSRPSINSWIGSPKLLKPGRKRSENTKNAASSRSRSSARFVLTLSYIQERVIC
jgi:hypothetical protein